MTDKIRGIIASAIANSRAMRRGMPSVTNVIDLLLSPIKEELLDDADNVINELEKNGISIEEKLKDKK